MVLRTLARGELPAPEQDRWHFSVQTLDDFLYQMETAQPPAQGVLDLMPAMARSRRPGAHGLSWLGRVTAQPRPQAELALLPPLRDDQAPPPPPLTPWQSLPPLRPGPPLPAPPAVARPAVPWALLPPLRPGGLAKEGGPELSPVPLSPAPLPPLPLVARPMVPWTRLPPLRATPALSLTAVSWQALPPLRGGEAALRPPTATGFPLLPPLRPAESLPGPGSGRRVPWESLPALRDAAVLPQRRVPWRRLPPLRLLQQAQQTARPPTG